jgi:hypothetical protein
MYNGDFNIFQLLLDNGADYSIPDVYNLTVDEYVEKYGQIPFKGNILLNFN